ncbi:MAG: hypothetical protein QGG88_09635 [Gammaproteobacteria bacterium]|nr:hypothetical protein [Gammaproteobacteria bacterium]
MEVQLIRRNRYQVGEYIVQKRQQQWWVFPLCSTRTGCIARVHEVLYFAPSLEAAIDLLEARESDDALQ